MLPCSSITGHVSSVLYLEKRLLLCASASGGACGVCVLICYEEGACSPSEELQVSCLYLDEVPSPRYFRLARLDALSVSDLRRLHPRSLPLPEAEVVCNLLVLAVA